MIKAKPPICVGLTSRIALVSCVEENITRVLRTLVIFSSAQETRAIRLARPTHMGGFAYVRLLSAFHNLIIFCLFQKYLNLHLLTRIIL